MPNLWKVGISCLVEEVGVGVLELDGDVVLGRFVQQRKDVALEGSEADGRVLGVGDGDDAGLTIFDAAAQFPGRFVGVAFAGGGTG